MLAAILSAIAAKPAPVTPTPGPTYEMVPYFAIAAAFALVGAYVTKQAGLAPVSTALGAAFAFAMLEAVDVAIKPTAGFSAFYPGHAPVAVILFAMPPKPATATAFAVFGGHVLVTLTSLLQLYLLPASLMFASKIFTVGLGILAMKSADAVHPPACAFALAFVGGNKTADFAQGPLIGCAVLIACQRIWLALPAPAEKGKKA